MKAIISEFEYTPVVSNKWIAYDQVLSTIHMCPDTPNSYHRFPSVRDLKLQHDGLAFRDAVEMVNYVAVDRGLTPCASHHSGQGRAGRVCPAGYGYAVGVEMMR